MRIFTRISTTVAAAIDRAVGSMENHDAVVESSIRDIRRAAGEARARLNRVRVDSERMRGKLTALSQTAARWEARAVGSSGDEATALECLRRRRECAAQSAQLEASLGQHDALEHRLTTNIARIDERLADLRRQRDVMRTREATAQALRSAQSVNESNCVADIDQTLERWDAQISEAELTIDHVEPEDALEREFLADEERESLRAELETLQRQKGEPS